MGIEKEISKNFLLIYLPGFTILAMGPLIIVSHPIWANDWRIIITILGWIILLKRILRIFFPKFITEIIKKKQKNYWFVLGELATLFIGFYPLYFGFIAGT